MDAPTGPRMMGNFRLPDKIGASAMTIALGAAGAYGLYRIEPMLIDFTENTLYLTGMVLVGFFVLSTLYGSREAIWYWQQNQIRKLRRSVIGEDPIGILDSVMKRLNKKIEQIEDAMASAKAALNQQLAAIKQAKAESDNEASLARTAQGNGSPVIQVKQHATASERWAHTVAELQPDADKMETMQERYKEALDLAQASLADADNQKRIMAMKVRTTEAKKKAFAGFKSLFGASDEWQMWGDAVEIIEQRSYEAEAQLDQLLDNVQPQIASQKLQQEADAQSAMARLGLLSKPQAQLPEPSVEGEVIPQAATPAKAPIRRVS